MAAPSRADVEGMITTALAKFEQRIGIHMQAMQTEHVSVVDAQASLKALADGARQEFTNSQSRIEQLITSNNTAFDVHKAALQKVVDDLRQLALTVQGLAWRSRGPNS